MCPSHIFNHLGHFMPILHTAGQHSQRPRSLPARHAPPAAGALQASEPSGMQAEAPACSPSETRSGMAILPVLPGMAFCHARARQFPAKKHLYNNLHFRPVPHLIKLMQFLLKHTRTLLCILVYILCFLTYTNKSVLRHDSGTHPPARPHTMSQLCIAGRCT